MNDVLIIDDTPENLTVLVKILTAHGYQVRPALSGSIALKAIQEEIPDLVLLDIMMPEMDGFEVCRKLKSDDRTKNIPVIFISALGDTENKIKGFKSGGVDYISKPFNADEVLARVETHLALRNIQVELLREIDERKFAEKALQQAQRILEERVAFRTFELNKKTERLAETNVTLKQLLEKRTGDQKELEENVMFNIEKLIIPYLERLNVKCKNDSQEALLKIIQSNFDEIILAFTQKHKDYLADLTPTQVQIADLIKQGRTTKEIAQLLNLSPYTIACHRQEIRKRLSLINKKINLRSALVTNT